MTQSRAAPRASTIGFVAALVLSFAAAAHAQNAPEASSAGFSNWNLQALYGGDFEEPFNPNKVGKFTTTLENSSSWSWGSSYFFADLLYSTHDDQKATEIYTEWYPSVSVRKFIPSLGLGLVDDINLTMGVNVGSKSTGAAPFVLLPGATFELKLPKFAFASLGVYAYIDRGQLNGESNNCHKTALQVTPSWLLPFSVGDADFQFGGFADFITSHGVCEEQVLSQLQFTIDAGKLIFARKGKFYFGTELAIWRNKFGIKDLDETVPQVLLIYKF